MASVENIAFTSDEVKAIIIAIQTGIEDTSHPDPSLTKDAQTTLKEINKNLVSSLQKMRRVDEGIMLGIKTIEETEVTQEDINKYTKPE